MEYVNSFFSENEGVETMEWLAIVLAAAALIGIALACGDQIKAKLSQAINYI